MAALIDGQRDPQSWQPWPLRGSSEQAGRLEQALTGRFTGHHAGSLEMLLAQHGQPTVLIDQVTTRINQAITVLPPAPPADPAGDPAGGPGTASTGDHGPLARTHDQAKAALTYGDTPRTLAQDPQSARTSARQVNGKLVPGVSRGGGAMPSR